jgi:hypothetical protein
MKITAAQLKKIIAEEIKKATLTEDVGMGVGTAELQTMLDVVCDGWKSEFNPEDPIMASQGKDVWDEQCEFACKNLGDEIEQLIRETGYAVHRGEYR